jgi:hypothetical protein
MAREPYEREEEEAAAAEAAGIGGGVQSDEPDPALRPLREAGEGEAEGFEDAERALVEHASHGDYQSAHWVLHHQGRSEEPGAADSGEPDHELSSEYDPEADEQA